MLKFHFNKIFHLNLKLYLFTNNAFWGVESPHFSHATLILTMRILLLLSCLLIVSCSSKRVLEKNELLLSTVKIESSDKHISPSSLQTAILQKPNNKWFGLAKVPLGMYSLAGKKDSSGICKLLRKIGEPPVVYDDLTTQQSLKSIKSYLYSKGFRSGFATYDTICKNHKLDLIYKIHAGPRSYVRNISMNIPNTEIRDLILKERHKSVLRGGMPLEINKLYEERDRIVSFLQNNGYVRVNKEFVTYTIDTIQGDLGVNVALNFKAPLGTDTTLAYAPHRLEEVIVYEDCSPYDSTTVTEYNGITFHHLNKKSNISRRLYRSMVKLYPDSLYRAVNVTYTNNLLNNLSAVNYSTIRSRQNNTSVSYDIYVKKAKPHSVSFDIEGTNTAGDLGAAASITYTNRNLFRGSELFRLKIRGAYEAITGLEGYSKQNYIEYSTEAGLSFPTILMPFSDKLRYLYQANTELNFIYNLQERPEFHRRMVTANFSYKWKKNNNNRVQHKLDLLSLNYIFMPWISNTFRQNYLEGDDPRYGILRYSYENLFIMNSAYSMVLNSNNFSSLKSLTPNNAWQLKFNIESAGNFLNLAKKALQASRNQNNRYELFGIEFSQYIKADFDFVKSHPINENSSIAFHAALGVAMPYGNSTMIPYEKRYFSGGANSVRGWSVRELGPGSYKGVDGKIDFINQTGNIKLDLSIEYRTYLFWKFYGAAFIDAGNIWNIRNYSQAGGKFEFNRFYKEIAVAYGLGLRLNFDYFILRFDGGMKAINPSVPTGRKHYPITCHKFDRDFTFHFAIGLPF